MVSKKKDSIGNTLSEREYLNREDGLSLVGFKPKDDSPNLGYSIGLGFINNGNNRIGEIVTAADPLRGNTMDVEIVSAHFIDPEGERLRV